MTATATSDQPTRGLSSEEARERLRRVGPNRPAGERSGHTLADLVGLLAKPARTGPPRDRGGSAWLGDEIGAAIIAAIVLIGAAIDFVQTHRSSRAILRLRAGVAVTATVFRDGEWREVPRRDVVPGDVIRLSTSDLVPADARLLTIRDLHVQQGARQGQRI